MRTPIRDMSLSFEARGIHPFASGNEYMSTPYKGQAPSASTANDMHDPESLDVVGRKYVSRKEERWGIFFL